MLHRVLHLQMLSRAYIPVIRSMNLGSDSKYHPHSAYLFLHPRYSHINEPQHQLHFLLIPNVSFLLPFFLRILNHSWLQDHKYSEQLLHFHLHPSHILYRLQICILQTYLIAREQTEIFLRRFFHEIISFNIEIFAECNFSGACFLIFLIISTGRYST